MFFLSMVHMGLEEFSPHSMSLHKINLMLGLLFFCIFRGFDSMWWIKVGSMFYTCLFLGETTCTKSLTSINCCRRTLKSLIPWIDSPLETVMMIFLRRELRFISEVQLIIQSQHILREVILLFCRYATLLVSGNWWGLVSVNQELPQLTWLINGLHDFVLFSHIFNWGTFCVKWFPKWFRSLLLEWWDYLLLKRSKLRRLLRDWVDTIGAQMTCCLDIPTWNLLHTFIARVKSLSVDLWHFRLMPALLDLSSNEDLTFQF